MNHIFKAQLFLSVSLMATAIPAIAAEDKSKDSPVGASAQTAKPVSPAAVTPVATPAGKPPAASAATKPSNNPDQDMSEALVKKINKSSGDIVLRSSDLPPPFPVPKAEVKLDVKVEKKVELKPKEPPKVEPIVITVKEELIATPIIIPEIPWTYADGPAGPENWGNLKNENQLCAKGKMQSPININFDNTVKGNLSPIVFEYRPFFLSLMDNGRTVEVIGAEGNNITLNEKQYRLVGFDIHKPSEAAFNGERAEMSIQLVHQHFDGSRVIVEVMLSSSAKVFEAAKKSRWDSPPKENHLVQILLNNVPLVKNQVASPRDVAINPLQLLPEDRAYFTYMGSLTEPPCNEGVTWVVMKNPVLVSAQQVHSFGQIYSNNVRPLQIKGDRIIKESR